MKDNAATFKMIKRLILFALFQGLINSRDKNPRK